MFLSRMLPPTLSILHKPTYKIFNSNFKLPLASDIDTANLIGLFNTKDTQFLSFSQKLAEFKFGSLYNGLDLFFKDFLFTIAQDYQYGLPAGIIGISVLIRLVFFYPTLVGQINGMKMKQIKPDLQKFQQTYKVAMQSKNKALMIQAKKQLNKVKKQKGIDTFKSLIPLTQMPIMLTWFFCLQQLTKLPANYPQLASQPFLWMGNIAAADPYGIFPILVAFTASLSIIYSPGLQKENLTQEMSFLIPYLPFIKWMPFPGLAVTLFLPGSLNLYFFTVSFSHLLTTLLLHTQYFKKQYEVKKVAIDDESPKLIKTVYINQINTEKFQSLKRSLNTDQDPNDQKKPVQNKVKLSLSKSNKKKDKNDKRK